MLVVCLQLMGCGQTFKGSSNPFTGLFEEITPTTPGQAARDAFNMHDPDIRARSVALLSAAPFGGELPYVKTYRMLLGSLTGETEIAGDPDPDPMVRATAVKALGLHGTVEDVALITPRLDPQVEPSKFVRWQAAVALQKIHNPDLAIRPLLVALREDPDADVRMSAARALGQYASAEVFDSLAAALDDSEYSVVHGAHESLKTLTGKTMPPDAAIWLAWAADHTDQLFDGQQTFTYKPYTKPRGLLDKAQFWNKPEPTEPRKPTGLNEQARG